MNNLLLDEQPLIVLPRLAAAVGLKESIVLQQLHYWLKRSHNERDGFIWVFNSYPQWQEQFPFLGIDTIKRTFRRLEKLGIIVSAVHNKHGFDKTKWYRIDYDKLSTTVSAESTDTEGSLHSPIPETTTKTTNNTITNVIGEEASQREETKEKPRRDNTQITEVLQHFESQFEIKLKQPAIQRQQAFNLIRRYTFETVLQGISAAALIRNERYAPMILDLKDLWFKWDKVEAFYKRKQQEQTKVAIITDD